MKSNIKIASNIYARTTSSIKKDTKYIFKINGYKALKEFKNRYMSSTLSSARLSQVQMDESNQPPTCAYAKNGEQTHGKIFADGVYKYVGRCEYKECKLFSTCPSSYNIDRKIGIVEETVYIDDVTPTILENISDFESLFNNISTPTIVNDTYIQEDFGTDIISPNFLNENKFIKTKDIVPIIESDISSRILVNAGPGTGKTFCAISRLMYVLKNNLASPEKIVILCYSRAAVSVIKERIQNAISNGELPLSSSEVGISTFDSFAAGYLYHILDEKVDSYNESIALFNQKMDKQHFDNDSIEYLIVDELQDLVNSRAKMTLNILNSIKCGYLLLGDKCQAIYDFEISDQENFTSELFYNELENTLPKDTLFYEILGNKRQSDDLAKKSDEIREILLSINDDEQYSFVREVFENSNIASLKLKELIVTGVKNNSAILCRTNGEALMISSELSKNKLPHTVLCGSKVKPKITRAVADVLWDYTEIRIAKNEFIKRYSIRVSDNKKDATSVFDALLCITDTADTDVLDLDLLKISILKSNELPSELLLPADDLIVSTIHRAKGREFDNVYLLSNHTEKYNQTSSEARIRYVAITRPRNHINNIERHFKWYFRSHKELQRPYKVMYRGTRNVYCHGIGINQDEHIDTGSFASALLPIDNLEIQNYISKNIQRYDEVDMIKNKNNHYEIFHNNILIGKLSENTAKDFWNIVEKTNDRRSIPNRLNGLRVSNLYTVVSDKHYDTLTVQHKKSGFWLGVEIIGMGLADYYN